MFYFFYTNLLWIHSIASGAAKPAASPSDLGNGKPPSGKGEVEDPGTGSGDGGVEDNLQYHKLVVDDFDLLKVVHVNYKIYISPLTIYFRNNTCTPGVGQRKFRKSYACQKERRPSTKIVCDENATQGSSY